MLGMAEQLPTTAINVAQMTSWNIKLSELKMRTSIRLIKKCFRRFFVAIVNFL